METVFVEYVDGRSSVEYPDDLVLSADITAKRLCDLHKDIGGLFDGKKTGLSGLVFDLEVYTTAVGCEYDYDESHLAVSLNRKGRVVIKQCFMRQVGVEDRLISQEVDILELIDYLWRREQKVASA